MRAASFTPVALAVLLAACASKPRGTPDNEPTLASLSTRKVEVKPDSVLAATPEQAAAAYQRFLDSAPRAPQRAEALRRIGDLAMDSADNKSADAGSNPDPDVDEVIEERTRRYRAAVADGSSVPLELREAVRFAAERVPLAIVSGAARSEIEPVVETAGLTACFATIVAAEDVEHGKPHPDGYLRALELLDAGLAASEVLVFEDTEAGVASAKAAGMCCFAVLGTLSPERLSQADEIVERIDTPLMQRLLDQA